MLKYKKTVAILNSLRHINFQKHGSLKGIWNTFTI
jgi:hypothetical protein